MASEDFTTKWRFYANAPISRIAENGLYAKLKKAMENYKDSVIIEEYNVLDNYNKGGNTTKDMIKK